MPPKKEKQPERPSASSSTSKSEKDGKGLSPDAIQLLLNNNPALAGEMQGMDQNSIAELLKKLKVGDLMTGMVSFMTALLLPFAPPSGWNREV